VTGVSTSVFTPFPAIFEASRVYAAWVNDNGGIKDADGVTHKLNVINCDDHYLAASTTACARQAVSKKITAYVGGFILTGDQIVPVLKASNIAYFGACCPVGGAELTADNAFNLGSNTIYQVGAGAAAGKNCNSIGLINADTPFKDYYEGIWKTAIKAYGKTIKVIAHVPLQPGDYVSQVAQVTQGTDCVIVPIGESGVVSVLTAMKQLGAHQRVIGIQGNLDAKACENFKDLCENMLVSGELPDITAPVWKNYRAALVKYKAKSGLDYNSLAGMGQWAALTAFANVISKMHGPITGPTFLAAVSKDRFVQTGGMYPTIDFTKPWTKVPATPRIFNKYGVLSTYKNGKVVPVPGFQDMTKPYFGIKPNS
jgi:ABC-type branched-subunit amino acid transport system substrate-binding protein